MKIVTKKGELLSDAEKDVAKAFGISKQTVVNYVRNGFPQGLKGKNIEKYIEENYPEFYSGTKIYILSVRTAFGKRLVLAACLKDELDEMKKKMEDAGIDVAVEEYVIGEITDEAKNTFFPEELPTKPSQSVGHRIEDCIPHTKAAGTIRKILLDLGCKTLEDSTKISPDAIMGYSGTNKRTLFELAEIFKMYEIGFDESAYGDMEKYRKKPDVPIVEEAEKENVLLIGKFDSEGNLVKAWKSVRSAAEELHIPMVIVEGRVKGKKKQDERFTLKVVKKDE